MKYLKKFENPDWITANNINILNKGYLRLSVDKEAFAFGYDEEGNMVVGNYWSVHNEIGKRRSYFKYAGRAWTKNKIISFWEYPQKDELMQVLKDIETSFNNNSNKYDEIGSSYENIFDDNIKIDGNWFIEIPLGGKETEIKRDDENWKKWSTITELIKIKDYLSSNKSVREWSKEEKNVIHNLDAKRKAQKLKELGYNPKQIKTPQGMSQAEYRDKITKYKYTENFDNFNKKNNKL